MAKKDIIWSDRASLELRNVLQFYNERNGNANYSLKILEEIDSLLNSLSNNDLLGRLTDNKRTRVLVMEVYLIFYEIDDSNIEILSFWDNRQSSDNRIDSIIN